MRACMNSLLLPAPLEQLATMHNVHQTQSTPRCVQNPSRLQHQAINVVCVLRQCLPDGLRTVVAALQQAHLFGCSSLLVVFSA